MRTPSLVKLLLGVAVVSLSACQCGPPEPALQVLINIDPTVPATCVVLEVSSGGTVRLSQELKRPSGKNAYRVGIKKLQLPNELQLVARSYSASSGTGCGEPRFQTSASAPVDAAFPRSDVATFTLEIHAPGLALDADVDGHIDAAKGGDDCNDQDNAIHPGLAAACGSVLDNDCDGAIGCNDSECATATICNQPPTGLAFVTVAQPVSVNACSPALTVEVRNAAAMPVLAAVDTPVALGVVPAGGVLLFSDSLCLTPVTQVTVPMGQSRASFHFKAAAPGSFDATATVLGLPTATQTQTVTQPAVAQLAFTNPLLTVAAGACSGALTLQTRDVNGNAAPVLAPASIALSSNQAGVMFFADAACGTALSNNALPIATGSSGGSFYVRATSIQPTTLTATLAALPPVSQSLTVTSGAPTQLAFATPAQGLMSGACSTVVTVETRDSANNVAPVVAATAVSLSSTGVAIGLFADTNCTIAITAPLPLAAGGSSVSFHFKGTVAGMALISADATGLTQATQVESVGVGPASKLVLSAAQSITAGQCSAVATVTTQDVNSNPSNVTGAPVPVTLGGPATGFAFFSDSGCANALTGPLSIPVGSASTPFYFRGTLAGAQNITATAPSLSPGAQTHTITPASPSVLAFTSPVQSQVAGTCAQFDLEARDAFGNPSAPSAASTVTLTSTPAITFSAAAGCATPAASVSLVGTTVTFFGRGTLAGAKSLTPTAPFGAGTQTYTVTAGAAAQLGFTIQPTAAIAGAALVPAVEVAIQDSFGNTVPTATDSVALALAANPGTGTLSGTVSVAAVAGVASFSTLSIDKVGVGYTLAASAATLTSATSAAFDIAAGAPAALAFSAQPTSALAGAALAPAVQVTVLDALGNVVSGSTATITLALGANPGSGVLSGTLSVAAVAGVASFSDLAINRVGAGYTLAASSGTLTGVTSAAFDITVGAAARLAFATQPTSAVAGAAIAPAVEVRVEDAQGNPVPTSTASITVAIGTNPGSGVLSGTLTVAAVAGVASFSTLAINKVGTGYTLAASAGGLTGVTSAAFDITVGAAARLAFTTQPTNAVAAAAIAPPVQVSVEDALGNRITTSTASITVAIGTNPGAGVLSGTLSVAAVAGVASFTDLAINKTGAGYTLTASAATLTGATSAAFDISAGAAAQLVFSSQPTNAVAGAAIAPAVQVAVQDAQGNLVTASTASITVALGTNPGAGVLSGTLSVAAVAGVASFSPLAINKVGIGYTLTASSTGLTGATSAAFDIAAGAAAQLVFSAQPTNAVAGAAIAPAVQVAVQDAQGNPITTSTAGVTLAIGTNPGGGTLAGTLTVAAVAGVASFANLSINKTGTGYTLAATSGALTGATSTAFDITPGAAALLTFFVQPSNTTAGAAITPAPQVEITDALGNRVTGSSANVTLAIGTNPGAGTLSGTTTVAAVSGLASFAGLSIDKSGTGYTLGATSAGLPGTTSTAFNLAAGAAAQLAFTVQPATAVAGASIAPPVQVAVQDSLGNTVTSSTAGITLAIGANPSAGVLSGTLTVVAVAGVASFSNLSINKAGSSYTLAASSGALTGGTSTAFDITPGAAALLRFVVQPSATAAGAAITPAPQVEITDALGNRVTGSSANLTIAIGTNPGPGTLSGTATVAAASGLATFTGLSLDKAGTGYTLGVTSAGLASTTSAAFDITAGAAAKLAFTVQPTGAISTVAIAPAVKVTVQDALGNTVTGSTASIVLAIANNPGAGALAGTLTVAAVAGVATFSDLSIDLAGVGYTLGASASGLTGATSSAFTITGLPPVALAILGSPLTINALDCSAIRTVELRDVGGNPTPSVGNTVVALSAAPGAATPTFYSDAACATGVTTRTIADGASQTSFYFKAENATATLTLTAASGSLTDGTQTATVSAASPTQLKFTTAAPTVEAGFCQALTLEREDALSRPTSPAFATTVSSLASVPATGISFFSDAACTTPLAATFNILTGASSTVVYTKGVSGSLSGTTPGNQAYALTATAASLTNGTLSVTVQPMVRRRSVACTLGGSTVTCPVTPTLSDLSRTILFFQATPSGADDNPTDDNVSCRLALSGTTGFAEVICERVGTGSNVNIEWQTVSFPYSHANGGVTVQRFTGGCTAAAAGVMPLVTAVSNAPLAESFVLFSTRSSGGDNDGGDYFQARLGVSGLSILQSDNSTTCISTMGYEAQVVSWAGATVNRAVTTGGAGGNFTVSQATPTASRTFLIYSSRMTGDLGGSNNICRRRLRGLITDTTTLTFDRGCTGADIQDISWEHVLLPTGASVQTAAGTIAAAGTTHAVAITAVDLTRSFAFTGGLGQGGSASGRTDYATNDRVGAALARTVLTANNELTFTRTTTSGNSAWLGYVVQLSP